MASNYNQAFDNRNPGTHFSQALFGKVESSRMVVSPVSLTTFNAGDIVPIYCEEILPDDCFSIDLDFVIRQTTLLTPTMGTMNVDFYAFFVPNRVVNQSFKAVMGENLYSSWTANPVSLAPLRPAGSNSSVQVPIGSVADYYGFPTQAPIPDAVLKQCHDLKFRGYVAIYNEFFRDQNYQPPIPMSTLNVYEGFFDPSNYTVSLNGDDVNVTLDSSTVPDGSVGVGAVAEALYGSGTTFGSHSVAGAASLNRFRALSAPLKANKLHDYFTSVLPSPQKNSSPVFAPVSGQISNALPVITSASDVLSGSHPAMRLLTVNGDTPTSSTFAGVGNDGTFVQTPQLSAGNFTGLFPSNLQVSAGASVDGLAISIEDLRMAAAIQQCYEMLARGGSRYRSYVRSFFGIEVDDPFSDIPQYLGHIRRDLDLYQTAQTSSSEEGSTPQGNLAAFGYTSNSGRLVNEHRFLEHGYLHIFAVVRHRNIYSSFLSRDNFRLTMLDYYQAPLANVSEQPVYTRELNPFVSDSEAVFGYQEAWAEYRYSPDRVSGYMRPGVSGSLSVWNYADDFSSTLTVADGTWLKSNSQSVLDRTLAVTSSLAHQFKGMFKFTIDKIRPMPTYSVPGMDII